MQHYKEEPYVYQLLISYHPAYRVPLCNMQRADPSTLFGTVSPKTEGTVIWQNFGHFEMAVNAVDIVSSTVLLMSTQERKPLNLFL